MTDRAWFDAAKGDIPQWAASMPKDADGTTIDWDSSYLNTLLKMLGITYVGQFSAGICKDAGYSSIAGQIELFARLAVLAVSMPVLLALLETVHDFL